MLVLLLLVLLLVLLLMLLLMLMLLLLVLTRPLLGAGGQREPERGAAAGKPRFALQPHVPNVTTAVE